MAEVLLVVAIIGITAALALPNLSQGIDEDKYVMMAKATYSELDSGFSRMLANKSLDEIYTDASNKGKLCKDKNIDLLVDDLYENIISCINEDVKVILFNKNKDYKGLKTTSWNKVYKMIMEDLC